MGLESLVLPIAFPSGSPAPAPQRSAKLDLRLADDKGISDPAPQAPVNLNSTQNFKKDSPNKALNLVVNSVNGLAVATGTALLIGSEERSFRRGAGTALVSGGAFGIGLMLLDKIYGPSPLGLKLGLSYGGGVMIGIGLHYSGFHPSGGGGDGRNPVDEYPNDRR